MAEMSFQDILMKNTYLGTTYGVEELHSMLPIVDSVADVDDTYAYLSILLSMHRLDIA